MSSLLIAGGTGVLGRQLIPRLLGAGYHVRVMSRKHRNPDFPEEVGWTKASLATGEGLNEAVHGVEVIIHAASSPFRDAKHIDVEGTRYMVSQAMAAGVSHFVYVSIVGIEKILYGYYQAKLAAERIIENEAVPWSILRATQFHELIDERFLPPVFKMPIVFLPTDFQFQLIDSREVADRLVEIVKEGPGGRYPDIGGPEVKSFGGIAQAWMAARGVHRRLFHLPLPGKTAAAHRGGHATCPRNIYGKVTFENWLSEKYGENIGKESLGYHEATERILA